MTPPIGQPDPDPPTSPKAAAPLDYPLADSEAGSPAGSPAASTRGLDARLAGAVRSVLRALREGLARSAEAAEPFMVTAGLLGLCGQPFFFAAWRYLFPQPYENLWLRLAGSALCLPLVYKVRWPERLQALRSPYWVLTVFFNLPFLFPYFLLQNGLSQVWLLSLIGGTFVLTFLVELVTAMLLFALGSAAAYAAFIFHPAVPDAPALLGGYLQALLLVLFPLAFGGIINYQLQHYRRLQHNFERRLRHLTNRHAQIVQDQNNLLSRFLSNVIVSRLRRFQRQHGLDEAIAMITRQERRFCGIMQADVRNFTKLFGHEPEIDVAQQIRRCFTEITEIGQDLAVIKPVGDSIFVYADDEHGRQNAVFNIIALAIFFVHSLQRSNRVMSTDESNALNFGIGLHAGEVIYGNLASETLIDPTIIGINVNRTARLEELTKAPAVQDLVGPNAILLSDEIAFYGSNFIRREHLVPLDLSALGLRLRDFPNVRQAYALRADTAEFYVQQATEHIRMQRSRPQVDVAHMEADTYHGVPYFYEMQGTGPNTVWMVFINASALPTRVVTDYAQRRLPDLEYEINHSDGQWLIVSTRTAPGEFDESGLELRVFRIIDELNAEAQGRPA